MVNLTALIILSLLVGKLREYIQVLESTEREFLSVFLHKLYMEDQNFKGGEGWPVEWATNVLSKTKYSSTSRHWTHANFLYKKSSIVEAHCRCTLSSYQCCMIRSSRGGHLFTQRSSTLPTITRRCVNHNWLLPFSDDTNRGDLQKRLKTACEEIASTEFQNTLIVRCVQSRWIETLSEERHFYSDPHFRAKHEKQIEGGIWRLHSKDFLYKRSITTLEGEIFFCIWSFATFFMTLAEYPREGVWIQNWILSRKDEEFHSPAWYTSRDNPVKILAIEVVGLFNIGFASLAIRSHWSTSPSSIRHIVRPSFNKCHKMSKPHRINV